MFKTFKRHSTEQPLKWDIEEFRKEIRQIVREELARRSKNEKLS